MDALKRYGPAAGRLLIAAIFVFSGIAKLTGLQGTAGYIASQGLPAAYLLAVVSMIVELGGGLLLIAGFMTRWAAAALLLFTLAAALIFHNFWAAPADQVQNTMIHFMKNISMAGGLLYVMVYGSGPLSVDGADS